MGGTLFFFLLLAGVMVQHPGIMQIDCAGLMGQETGHHFAFELPGMASIQAGLGKPQYNQFAIGICRQKLIDNKPVPYLPEQQAICSIKSIHFRASYQSGTFRITQALFVMMTCF